VVTTGTTTVPAPIAAGDTVRATFGPDAALGQVTVSLGA
jgi:2-keto-4-pentenoate hydratase